MKITSMATGMALALCGAVYAAEGAAGAAQRAAGEQHRIAGALASGQLSVRAASRLERAQQRLAGMQARALAEDGGLDASAQDGADTSPDGLPPIRAYDGGPRNADASQVDAARLAEVVQRSSNQQQRIARGLRSGELTNAEAARLEQAQARLSGMLADATADGHVDGAEQSAIETAQRRLDRRIYARNRNDHGLDPRDRY